MGVTIANSLVADVPGSDGILRSNVLPVRHRVDLRVRYSTYGKTGGARIAIGHIVLESARTYRERLRALALRRRTA
jgi:hypothetical protein